MVSQLDRRLSPSRRCAHARRTTRPANGALIWSQCAVPELDPGGNRELPTVAGVLDRLDLDEGPRPLGDAE